VLEGWIGVDDASPVYLLAVVTAAALFGTPAAIATSILSVLVYDFLFTEPRLTFAVASPQEWLSLLLFLVVAAVTGRLAAVLRERAEEARRTAVEAQSLFAISHSLATATSIPDAALQIVRRLRDDASLVRAWVVVGGPAEARILADSDSPVSPGGGPTTARPPMDISISWLLRRRPGDIPAEWIQVHEPRRDDAQSRSDAPDSTRRANLDAFRVLVQADGHPFGTVWGLRDRSTGGPDRGATRLFAHAADQLGLALRREQLRREATDAEIARRSDALKTALLDSVSHDLRTPLAGIRAIAGSLTDPDMDLSVEQRREMALAIDQEAERLGRYVRALLDVSRIQSGTLLPDLEIYPLRELVEPVIERVRPLLGDREVQVEIPEDVAPVVVDGVLFDQALGNLLDNVITHAPPPAPVWLTAHGGTGDVVELTLEDGGPGVALGEHERLFDRFYRARSPAVSPGGLGIGLTVARGFVEAMHGRLEAGPSDLGGLKVTMVLPAEPAADEPGPDQSSDRSGEGAAT